MLFAKLVVSVGPGTCCRVLVISARAVDEGVLPLSFLTSVTSSNVLRKGSLQTKLNAGLSEQQQEDLFQNERSFHEVKL